MKNICLHWRSGTGGGPMPTVPSPQPPWLRSPDSPLANSIFGDGIIALVYDTTYLNSQTIRYVDPEADPLVVSPYVVTLPDGDYTRQIRRIYIPGQNITPNTTAEFNVIGKFNGFSGLTFNALGWSAVLEWDGVGWHLIGGNALPTPS